MHGGDDRLRVRPDTFAEHVSNVAPVVAGGSVRGWFGAVEIGPGGEGPAGALDHGDTDTLVRGYVVEGRAQLRPHEVVDRVQLFRAVERYPPDAILLFVK